MVKRLLVVGGGAVASAMLIKSGGDGFRQMLVGESHETLLVETEVLQNDVFMVQRLLELQRVIAVDKTSELYMSYVRLVDAIDRQMFEVNRVCDLDEHALTIQDRITSFENFKLVESHLTKIRRMVEVTLVPRQAAVVGQTCQKLFIAVERYWSKALGATKKVSLT